jgi:uncharacterized protein YndB with AHSA1/START domain
MNYLSIKATLQQVFRAVSTPTGLDSWWTKRSSGEPTLGADYDLSFGPDYDWRAVVSRCVPDTEFELEVTRAQEDWQRTRVGFLLEDKDGVTQVQFYHSGWPAANEHYQVSCYCWAMYLRLLQRYVEYGELVPYEDRLQA